MGELDDRPAGGNEPEGDERAKGSGKRKLYPVKRSSGEIDYMTEDEIAALNAAKHERHQQVRQRRKLRKQRDHVLTGVVGAVALLALYVSFGHLLGGTPDAAVSESHDQAADRPPLIVSAPSSSNSAIPVLDPGPDRDVVGRPARDRQATPSTKGEGTASGARSDTRAAVARAPVAEPPPALSDVPKHIGEWAATWSFKELDGYFASYSSAFEPVGGISLEEWRAERRERIRAPEWISVQAQDIRVASGSRPGTATAVFRQLYSSPGYSDVEDKILDLVIEDGRWRIRRERVIGGG
ncbi:MAG: L,D-transpeptidase Cds6 family protein [Gammaproteobacteria bacterium]